MNISLDMFTFLCLWVVAYIVYNVIRGHFSPPEEEE